jgi:hypothetical protein
LLWKSWLWLENPTLKTIITLDRQKDVLASPVPGDLTSVRIRECLLIIENAMAVPPGACVRPIKARTSERMDVFNFIALKSRTKEPWLHGYCDFPSQFTPILPDRKDRSRRRLKSAAGVIEMCRTFRAKGNWILVSPSSS